MPCTMTPEEVQALRDRINAAWAANDRATADQLQADLHRHFVAEADRFTESPAGAAWGEHILLRP